jgi:pilus assembly protein CpaB
MAQKTKSKGRILIYLGLLLIMGVALVWVLVLSPQASNGTTPPADAQPAEAMSNIVISVQPVQYGQVITADMVTLIPYPERLIVPGLFFTDINDVIGQRVTMDIAAKTPLTSTLITSDLTGSLNSYKIPDGMVAVTIPVISPIASVGYLVQPGDHVNVIGTLLYVDVDAEFQSRLPDLTAAVQAPGMGDIPSMTALVNSGTAGTDGRAEQDPSLGQPVYLIPSEQQRPRIVSQTLLQNILVLDIGENEPAEAEQAASTPTPAPSDGSVVVKTTVRPRIVTLVVTPQDAVALNYLVYSGVQMNLALRGAGDTTLADTNTVSLQAALDLYHIVLPARIPYSLEPAVTSLSLPSVDTFATPY